MLIFASVVWQIIFGQKEVELSPKNPVGKMAIENVNELFGPKFSCHMKHLLSSGNLLKPGTAVSYLCAATFRKNSFAGSVPRGKRWVDRFLTRISKSFIGIRPCCKKQYEKWVRLRPMILFLLA